jgi:hypothetical protein
MMQTVRRCLCMVLSTALIVFAQGNTWNRVRYNGGTIATKVSPDDWGNKLTVTSDLISLVLKDGQKIEIQPKSVTALSYGQEAHRRVGTMILLGILLSPLALFGLFHKTRLHYIGIEFKTADEKPSALLLQGDKDNYRAILVALQGVTGAPVTVSEQDRSFIPVGVTTTVSKEKEAEPPQPATQPQPGAQTQAGEVGTVSVTSDPAGADVYSDGSFVGNAPATLKLAPGKHSVQVKEKGFNDWARDITVDRGEELRLTATLEKTN